MPSPINIQHPLLNRPGMSQRKRGLNLEALKPEFAKLDNRSMVDMLLFIHGYARNVIFYNHKVDPEQGPYAEVGDWLDFFENSLPFHLARFSDFNAAAMEAELDALAIQVKEGKSVPDLQLLFDHVYNEFFVPVERVWRLVDATAFKFLFELNEAIQTHIAPALERYLTLRNTAAKHLCIEKISFDAFMRPPWDIPMERLFQSDEKVTRVPGGEQGAIDWFRDELTLLAGELLRILGSLAELAPNYVEESLNALEKRNEPHLGLLFAFIKLYTHFQKDLNNLSVAHLDFFYQRVLKIEGRRVKPDKVHLIFEIANHLNDGYLVEKGTTFRDGQDINEFDVDFKLDDEIIIDKAQVVSLRTLYIDQRDVDGQKYPLVKGVYIAPEAKSSDGKGEAFTDDQSRNWATFGAKLSKFIISEDEVPKAHPFGRIGFALSSPVLYLNEGKREIKITLTCSYDSAIEHCINWPAELFTPFDETYYKITQHSISVLQTLIRIEVVDLLKELLEKQDPYPIGYSSDLNSLLNQLGSTNYKSESITISDEEKTEIENHLEKDIREACFVTKQDVEAHLNDPDLSDEESQRLNDLVDHAFDNWKYRFIDTTDAVRERLQNKLRGGSIFNLSLSGSESWFTPECIIGSAVEEDSPVPGEVKFEIFVALSAAEEAVQFFNEELNKELLDREDNYPICKIELNPLITFPCGINSILPSCCLDPTPPSSDIRASIYDFFGHLILQNAKIEVKVCGVKNLIVQNEENIQDVNELILPFGVRPKIGAEFFIGSKEVFCKQWDNIYLNVKWKDKPVDLGLHYEDYFKENEIKIKEKDFQFRSSFLEDGIWKTWSKSGSELKHLYVDDSDNPVKETNPVCTAASTRDRREYNAYHYERFASLSDEQKDFDDQPLAPKGVNTRDGYLRLTLQETDFLHDIFPFVLARNLINLAGLIDPNEVPKLKEKLENVLTLSEGVENNILEMISDLDNEIIPKINSALTTLATAEQNLINAEADLTLAKTDLTSADTEAGQSKTEINNAEIDLKLAKTDLQSAKDAMDSVIDDVNGTGGISSTSTAIRTDLNTAISQIDAGRPDLARTTLGLALSRINIIITKIGDTSTSGSLLFHVATGRNAVVNGESDVSNAESHLITSKSRISNTESHISNVATHISNSESDINSCQSNINSVETLVNQIKNSADALRTDLVTVKDDMEAINADLVIIDGIINKNPDDVGVPNEPYTPLLKSISIDYDARSYEKDISLIHLFPFENGSKKTSFDLPPSLVPGLEDEGTLFIGLDRIRPGATLQLLFQLAEATADSESDRAKIKWHYLSDNEWKPLRTGFEIISDDTNELTRSGIVKLSLPRDITKEGNTIMPPVGEEGEEKPVYWIKVSSRRNIAGVAETINIHTQAALATYEVVDGADLKRVEPGLPPEQLSKPLEPDFNIKQVLQPYSAFGGKAPEQESLLYKRVSEHLRHKGRSIDAFDIEHLVLEAFPSIFKCKCISHTLGLSANQFRRDLEVAPGFVGVAVIPDLTKLVAGDGLEPKVPVSMLEEIKSYLKKRMSPFARLRVMNPRYEKIKVDTTVRIKPGRDETFYLNQLKQDLTHFLAPWHLGDSDKLSFGQSVTYSEVIGFMENLDYIDFIDDLKLFDPLSRGKDDDPLEVIVPATARSILTGGKICTHKNEVECDPTDSEKPDLEPNGDANKKTHLFRSIEEKLEGG